jgi:hypothetical protein
MTCGFKSEQPSDQRTCLRLVKNLYGLSVAPRLWYQHICEALLQQGLKQSATDSCLLYSKTIMIVLYVDDLGIAYSNKQDLDKPFQDLTELGLEFTREGTFADFLGIKLSKIKPPTRSPKHKRDCLRRSLRQQDCRIAIPTTLLLCKIDLGLILMENLWMNSGTSTGPLLEYSSTCQLAQGQTSHLL